MIYMENNFIGCDYTEVTTAKTNMPRYIDSYACFGWELCENAAPAAGEGQVTLRFKRDRKIMNKAELTRLTRQFDACMNEIDALERSKTSFSTAVAIAIGLIGTAFMAGSTFAVTAARPLVWLCVLLAVPGFAGWIAPYFAYRQIVRRRAEIVAPLIEAKYDEIYAVCEKGCALL